MGGGLNPSARAEVLCRFSCGVRVTVIKKPFTPLDARGDIGQRSGDGKLDSVRGMATGYQKQEGDP